MVTRITVRDGAIDLPDDLRDLFGIENGTVLLAEAGVGGIFLRPDDSELASELEIEIYTPERKAEFFLNNATDAEEYRWARDEVERMGLNPDDIPHQPIHRS